MIGMWILDTSLATKCEECFQLILAYLFLLIIKLVIIAVHSLSYHILSLFFIGQLVKELQRSNMSIVITTL